MTTSQTSRGQRVRLPGLESVCWVVGLVLLYVASFGPAHSLVIRGQLPPQFLRAFYVMLPKAVAWRSLQIWRSIDKGAKIEGFWFVPSQKVWRGL